MRLIWPVVSCALVSCGVVYAVLARQSEPPLGVEISKLSSPRSLVYHEPQTSAGLCPWRAPDQDRRLFFPASTSSRDETLILSRHRVELQSRLGRMPGADDGALIVHRILAPEGSPGVVVTRRVRGECGLIELVLAVDNHGRVLGARVQRHREPEATATALFSDTWLGAFRGRDSRSSWKLGEDIRHETTATSHGPRVIPAVDAGARASAKAIVQEARTVLILLEVAGHSDSALPPAIVPAGQGHG